MDPQLCIPEEMIQRYIERRRTDLGLVETAIAKKDFDTLARVGHQIKGNAATFSFHDLEKIGISLEDSALRKDRVHAVQVTVAFRNWVEAREKLAGLTAEVTAHTAR